MSSGGLAAVAGPRRGATDLTKVLADEWTRALLRALADGPRQPCELERLVGISRSTLYARLGELAGLGIVRPGTRTKFPLRVEYWLSDSGRVVFVSSMFAQRQQRRLLPSGENPSVDGLRELLRVLAPAARLSRAEEGTCMMIEHAERGPRAAAWLTVEQRRLKLRARSPRGASPDVTVQAWPDAWDRAIATGDGRRLDVAGDRALAKVVLRAFASALA